MCVGLATALASHGMDPCNAKEINYGSIFDVGNAEGKTERKVPNDKKKQY